MKKGTSPSLVGPMAPNPLYDLKAMGVEPGRGDGLDNMVWIPGGTFTMGSDTAGYPEEGPAHLVSVDGFWMDAHPVTVEGFRSFVDATGYVTVAERAIDPVEYPQLDPSVLRPGSMVFTPPRGPVDLTSFLNWWRYVPGADWAHPAGPDSDVDERALHPVVHVAWDDVAAYAMWAGKEIPTEAEWERAARGGIDGAVYAWGDEFEPSGMVMANTWSGEFPWENLKPESERGTTPVGVYPSNPYGLVDMIGNVWEWTSDFYRVGHDVTSRGSCCASDNPRIDTLDGSYDDNEPGGAHVPRRVVKGGSYLCAANYCQRYRPSARQAQQVESSMSHLGFRCIRRPKPVGP